MFMAALFVMAPKWKKKTNVHQLIMATQNVIYPHKKILIQP